MSELTGANMLLIEVHQGLQDAIRQAAGNNAKGENGVAMAELAAQLRRYNDLLDQPPEQNSSAIVPGVLTDTQRTLATSFNTAVKNGGGTSNGVGLARMAEQVAEFETDIRKSRRGSSLTF